MSDLSSFMVYAIGLRNAGVCYARLGDFAVDALAASLGLAAAAAWTIKRTQRSLP